MKRDELKQEILDSLIEDGAVELDDLVARFSVSKMTIHRDLDDLEQLGMLRKIRGGATFEAGNQFESDFRFRELQGGAAKEAMSQAALKLIGPGMTVIVNDGSTAAALGRKFGEIRSLTVITNNDAVLTALKGRTNANLIALVGAYSGRYNGYFGKVTEDALTNIRADIAFISSPAVMGLDVFHMDETVARTKRAMMASSGKRCLLVNHTRFGHHALHKFAGISEFEDVITDRRPPPDTDAVLKDSGVRLTIAEQEEAQYVTS